ncbi:MAG: phosphoribosylformylglycinamidine synthase subunit PurL [Candidatus Levyibacteriota bacterium]
MIQIIRVRTKGFDLQGQGILHDIKHLLNNVSVNNVKTTKVYLLEGITKSQAKILAEKLLCESINQIYSINKPLLDDNASFLEIAYKPGVMNPESASIIKAASDIGIKVKACDSSKEYAFFGKLKENEREEIVKKLNLLNPIVEQILKKSPTTLLITGQKGKSQIIDIKNMNDEKLLSLSKDKLFLNLEEMKLIQNYFKKIKRNPTDLELETIAQTWSEHCAHKTFKAKLIVDEKQKNPLISRIKKEALKHKKNIVSAFIDNSGVMDFYDDFGICGKVETHNAPSAIEPYGGAMTGSGGVFRDILGTGLGAKTIASTDIFCFAKPDMNLSMLPKGCLSPLYLLKNVVRGVKDYGNRMGIPTNNGSVHFHNDFRAKPTIIVGAYGIIPKNKAQKGQAKTGDLVIAVGGKTGRDGIHGATFSSGEMTERTINVNSSAVQIGNAIEEKRMFDAIIEARDKNLIRVMQDCGAGGFSSAIGEMAELTGVEVFLEKAPLKYQGLDPWEIWVSESQERMTLAIDKKNLKKIMAIFKKYNVKASVLGKFTKNKKLKIYYFGKIVCDLEMKFLHHGLPQRTMKAKKQNRLRGAYSVTSEESFGHLRGGPKNQKEWTNVLGKILSSGNIASKEPILRLYDHSVMGTNSLQPFSGVFKDGPNDAVVLRPLLNKKYGMVISHGLNPVLNNIDSYWGSIWAATEAISNYTACGGDYKNASLINNYIWPFPNEESLWFLDKSVDAVCDFMKALKIPVVSGKDSLSSTYRGKDGKVIKIPPVLCISVFGKIPDVAKTVTSDFKKENSVLCLVGKMDFEGMGGSVYFDVMKQFSNTTIPYVNLKQLPKTLDAIYNGIKKGEILSCHDVSEGGLLTTIFEMCVGGNLGTIINLPKKEGADNFLFNETAGCFVVEVENETIAKKLFKNIPFVALGKTQKKNEIEVKNLFKVGIDNLKKSWQKPIKEIFG